MVGPGLLRTMRGEQVDGGMVFVEADTRMSAYALEKRLFDFATCGVSVVKNSTF